MAQERNNPIEVLIIVFIGIPILLALFVVVSPFLLFMVADSFLISQERKRFIKRNSGKKVLCVSPGRKYQQLCKQRRAELLVMGIDDIVVFDSGKRNNRYDNFEWDQMIAREKGFPVLVEFRRRSIMQLSFKNEFRAFMQREVNWRELRERMEDR